MLVEGEAEAEATLAMLTEEAVVLAAAAIEEVDVAAAIAVVLEDCDNDDRDPAEHCTLASVILSAEHDASQCS